MNKQQLTDAVLDRSGGAFTAEQAALAVELVLDVFAREVAAGRKVSVTGFGTLQPHHAAARVGRNPHTGARVTIPAKRHVRFEPGLNFKALLEDEAALGSRLVTSRQSPTKPGTSVTDGHQRG